MIVNLTGSQVRKFVILRSKYEYVIQKDRKSGSRRSRYDLKFTLKFTFIKTGMGYTSCICFVVKRLLTQSPQQIFWKCRFKIVHRDIR
jgi:hypothetical protein